MVDTKTTISALLPRVDGNPAAMLELARLMLQDGQRSEAVAMCQQARALAPHDGKLDAEAVALLSAEVPAWHFSIVRDDARNAAYDTALRRAITPGVRVLEIGTGTGIIAMMAARAGAGAVFTCEANPLIAQKARAIIAHNGFADRVQVIAKHSDALDADLDLGGRVDLLVSEIVSDDLLGEGVLPAHERAMRDLVRPGGIVLPARGCVLVALADYTPKKGRLGIVDGFDLSLFNEFLPAVCPVAVGDRRFVSRSAPQTLFAFDFGSAADCLPGRAVVDLVATGGRVTGCAQWIALEMDDEGRYEVGPPAPGKTSCWGVRFHSLPQPLDTRPGQVVRVCGSHNRHALTVWFDGAR